MKKRAGIIGSSGGSALIAAMQCLEEAGHFLEPIIVTDRPCGMARWAEENGHALHSVAYLSPEQFSREASGIFHNSGCEDVLLFYTRRVASPLIDEIRVWNIHPGLLPAFAGLHAVEQALAADVKLLGATLHRVDAGLDTGPITAQVAAVLPPGTTRPHAQRLSYLQKVWLTLTWFDLISRGELTSAPTENCGPGVMLASAGIADTALQACYLKWQESLEPVLAEDKQCRL